MRVRCNCGSWEVCQSFHTYAYQYTHQLGEEEQLKEKVVPRGDLGCEPNSSRATTRPRNAGMRRLFAVRGSPGGRGLRDMPTGGFGRRTQRLLGSRVASSICLERGEDGDGIRLTTVSWSELPTSPQGSG